MTQPTMVERVARAICMSQGEDPETLDVRRICDRENNPLPLWHWYVEQAEAAIKAMRDPTPEMLKRAHGARRFIAEETNSLRTWEAMIDAALSSRTGASA